MGHFRKRSLALLIAAAGFAVTAQAQQTAEQTVRPQNKILAHALEVETGRAAARPHEQHLSSGVMFPLLTASGALGKHNHLSSSAPMGMSNDHDNNNDALIG